MIEVNHLKFTYPESKTPAVNDISFTVQKGEVFGFLGPNGAGKSTTQKILIGLLKHYEGQVSIMGKARSEWDESFYEKIGVGFEVPNFYSKLTAQENLDFFASFYSKKCLDSTALLEMVDLTENKNKKVGEFSKGMKVRLNFVRAIQHDPEILFLDEPTSGLDPVNQRLLRELIKKQQQAGKTIFLTTHNMTDADQLCDRVAFIVNGKLVVVEKPNELKIQQGQKVVSVGVRNGHELQYSEFPLEGLGQNQPFLQYIQQHKVETIHSKEATLDDIFIKVTGARLE